MPLDLIISSASDKPIYQQLFEQLSSQIILGQLREGYCLPPIRTVAKELQISVITVKKAWEELERAGLIHSMVGRGCFVAPMNRVERLDKRNEMALQKLKKDVEYYRSLGIGEEEIIDLIRTFYRE
ncbi:MAG: GntR family transcriptional regulator [Clostridiales bacterium]|nr:GntR family transcriptional regulator [Clostridiales bacterium]